MNRMATRSQSRTEECTGWDLAHSWHPFTQMREYSSIEPVHIERGEGVWLTDTEGRRYLDGNASVWTNVHGHNDPDLNAALRDQLEKVAHSTYLGLSHPCGAELGHVLAELAPGTLDRCFFSDNGSNAIEIALKMSFQYWQLRGKPEKRRVIGMENAYHGDTFGTMAAGDSGAFHDRFRPWFFPADHFPAPRCRECAGEIDSADDTASLAALERHLRERSSETACLIIEPSVQGAAGMRQQPPGFLRKVEALCRSYDIHLILDEVFVGFGRLGPMLVCAEEGVEPDFLCLAKGLSAGYLPLAATLVRDEIHDTFLSPFEAGKAFIHGHTFTANPLAAAVSLASIRKLAPMIGNGSLQERAAAFGQRLAAAFGDHPNIAEVRQRGFSAAIDLQPGGDDKSPFPASARVGLKVCLAARARRLIVRPLGNSILIVPPLCISEDEIRFLVESLLAAVNETLDDPAQREKLLTPFLEANHPLGGEQPGPMTLT